MRYDFEVRVDENGNFKVKGLKKLYMIHAIVPKGDDPLATFLPMLREQLIKVWGANKTFTIGKMAQTSNRFYIWIN